MIDKIEIEENGIVKEYKVIKLCKYNNNTYMIYKGKDKYYASKYINDNDKVLLENVNSKDEWDYLERELNNE